MYNANRSRAQQRSYFTTLFTILEKNLHNYYERTTYEGLMITLEKQELNKQV